MKHKAIISFISGVVITLVMCVTIPTTKALFGVGDITYSVIMPEAAALEQINKAAQQLAQADQIFRKTELMADDNKSEQRSLAAWIGNKKLLETSYKDPKSLLERGFEQWKKDFDTSDFFKMLSGKKDIPSSIKIKLPNKDKEAIKDTERIQAGGQPRTGDLETKWKEQIAFKRLRQREVNLEIEENYFAQKADGEQPVSLGEIDNNLQNFLDSQWKENSDFHNLLNKDGYAVNTTLTEQLAMMNKSLINANLINLRMLQVQMDYNKMYYLWVQQEYERQRQDEYSRMEEELDFK